MSTPKQDLPRVTRFLNRLAARRATFGGRVTAFVSQPDPRTIGSFARGRQLCAGNYLFSGHLVRDPGKTPWDIPPPDTDFSQEVHGFTWLDDLAAAGDATARACAQDWLWRWINLYGRGRGPGWTPDLTGRRVIRWINHAIFLLSGRTQTQSDEFLRSLAQQTQFLSRRWRATAPGLPRFEALTGLVYAGLSLEGLSAHVGPASAALARECARQVDEQGGLPTRNPEELLEVFTLLTWAAETLTAAGQSPMPAHWSAIERISPTLRTLRHADGGLARFHGGGRGLDGRLDAALAASNIKGRHANGLSMGFARLSAGRSSLIVDAALPPEGKASGGAHASTLAFELTAGRRPLIVNCGAGASFGAAWRRAGRATPSHSTLVLNGHSSSRLGKAPHKQGLLVDGPSDVPIRVNHAPDGLTFEGGHDGYVKGYGLNHVRKLEMTFDGRGIAGEDMLLALEDSDKRRFDRVLDTIKLRGIPFDIRFHLHPDVDVSVDMGGTAVSMALKSGEIWIFRGDGTTSLCVETSVYLETGRLKPRATKQIVLSGRAMEYATRTRWSLAKPQDSPIGVRDLAEDGQTPVALS
ncbi:Heparinase II/III-like protein [Roseovarius sp. THAF9]|uniref:heparinase II/III family protein n=1 Tax=Roseovarius sp. THAF9 TaxID=2587847 RepID=UPI00126851B2|nr:heparinase II/III family protein [Roseovarius sp. THAF9]QFT91216.1 Heparinase II/III-like protein [Roseovarius sp. THAF9]